MRGRLIDLTGQIFGRLTVIQQGGFDKYRNALWLCKCTCGTEKIIVGTSLRSGNTNSCGCLRDEITRDRVKLTPGLANMRRIFGDYKRIAKRRGHTFDLTEKQFAELIKKDCHYCGAKPNNVAKQKKCNGTYIYNGLDRIDNTKGYTLDNVVPCCINCNMAKNTQIIEEFNEWIKRVYNKMLKREDLAND